MSFKLCFKRKILLWIISFGLANYNCLSWAQTKPNPFKKTVPEAQENSYKLPKLPPRGAPIGRRRGGTSRNNCPPLETPLTALVPGEETSAGLVQSNSFLASTVSENPTFWFYIPKLPEQVQTGEFILQNEAGEDLERTQIKLPSTEGAIAISLPSNSSYSLTVGKKYHWYFKIYCDLATPESDYIFVDAWIDRVALTSNLKIQLQITNREDYLVYSDHHIWYDALTSLGEKILSDPNSKKLKADWFNFLELIELSNLGNLPIVKIYQL